uniref:DUF4105 domain-containing protein n=1 Tax=Roseihalotalea indica TaxID=2867963 RepID=A0AA49GS62_9BACT|nr:hypothetical protein K4G66_09935 [Tunicatimonas sp. TK19036]
MKTFIIVATLLGMTSTTNYAQWNRTPEVSGAVYLSDGSELLTPFTYDEKKQVLWRENSSSFKVLTTFHVDSFFFYDPKLNWQRRFKKLNYQQRPQFFEVVARGPLEILRLRSPFDAPERVVTQDFDRQVLDYRFFVYQQGKLSTLNGYDISSIKETHPHVWREIRRYRRAQHFSFYKMHHKLQIIQKVNDLLSDEPSELLVAGGKP